MSRLQLDVQFPLSINIFIENIKEERVEKKRDGDAKREGE